METLESKYLVDIDDFVKKFTAVSGLYDEVAAKEVELGKKDPFREMTNDLSSFQRKLADGTAIFQKTEASVKGIRAEMQRLRDIEKALVVAQVEFANSAKFDTVQKDLIAVRQRLVQVQDAYKAVSKGAKDAGKSAKEFGGNLQTLGDYAKKAGAFIVAAFTVNKAIDIGKTIIENTSTYEKYFAVLRNGFQDEQRASTSLQLIYKFAKETPYQINEITEAYVRLVNRGFVPTEKELTKLGDFASANAKSMTQWVEAIVDAETNQYERLREFGVGFQTIGDKVQFTYRGMVKEVEKGNAGAIRQALLSFGELNGVVGAMGARALTLEGQLSNLDDSFAQLWTTIGNANSGTLKTFIGIIQKAVEFTKEWFEIPLAQKYREEQIEINSLVSSLIAYKDNAQLRNAILTELQQKYPSIIALIGTEVTSNGFLVDVLKQVNREYERKIQLAGLQEAVNQKTREQATLQSRIIEQEQLIQKTVAARLKDNKVLLQQYLTTQDVNVKRNIERVVSADLNDNKIRSQGVGGGGLGGSFSTGSTADLTAINAFNGAIANRNKLTGELNELTTDSIDLSKKIAATEAKEIENLKKSRAENDEKIKQLKAKHKLSDEEKKDLTARINLNKELDKREALALGTYVAPGANPPKAPDEKAAKKAERERIALAKEHEKLLELQRSFEEEMQKLRLDADNVRLQFLDKSSKDYLDLKRSYDLKQLDEETKKYEKLFDIQSGKAVKDGFGGTKIQSFTEGRINELQVGGMSKKEAEKQADLELSVAYANSQKTLEQRKLMRLKAEMIDRNYYKDLAEMQEEANAQEIELLGEGEKKTLLQIDRKYKALMEKYGENEAVLRQLIISYNEETEKLSLESKFKSLDRGIDKEKSVIDQDPQRAGEIDSDFEKRKRMALLNADRDYYSEKLKLLGDYLQSANYLEAVASGVISAEQSKEYQARLDEIKTAISKLDKEANKSSLTTAKYGNNWEVVGDVFEAITGKVLKFSDNVDIDKFVKSSITNAIGQAKQGLTELLNMELENSNQRLQALDESISQREEKINEEFERYKLGLSNNYLFEKQTLEAVKKEREKELENKKKIQKQQAIVDSLAIASANLVATANMIVSASAAIADGAKLGLVGVALGIAAAVALVATFVSIKARFKQAQQLRTGTKFGKRLEGRSHEEGGLDILDNNGNVQYEAEGDEWLIGSKPSKKHNSLLKHINEDSFSGLTYEQQKRMLVPLGLKMHENSFRAFQNDMSNRKQWEENSSREKLAESKKQSSLLKSLVKNTDNSAGYNWVNVGEGKIAKINSKGQIIKSLKIQWAN